MKFKEFATVLGLTLGIYFYTGDLNSWERQARDYSRCKNQGESEGYCKRKDAKVNKKDFQNLLNSKNLSIFKAFSSEEKTRAMDYADGNKMSPNKAVEKLHAELSND